MKTGKRFRIRQEDWLRGTERQKDKKKKAEIK
jgi:hypothetical protein